MPSYFSMISGSSHPRPLLSGEVQCDVCVIGGGICGILTAHVLAQHGLDVVLLEADRLTGGQTRGTTAKITVQHGLFAGKLIRAVGLRRAQDYVRANEQALSALQVLIKAEGVECGFSPQTAYLYTLDDPQPLYDEALACQKLGLEAQIVSSVSAPLPVSAALKVEHQAQMNPLPLLAALSAPLHAYEHTRALELDGTRVLTENGSVRAQSVAVCTHYPAFFLPGMYFLRLHQERSYVLALRSPKGKPCFSGMYYGIDAGGISLRSADDVIFLGGAGHRCGEAGEAEHYEQLRQVGARLFPEAQEIAHWSAQDCVSADGMPYVGRYGRLTPGVFVATGFGKWGMTNAMAAALLLRALITGQESPYERTFSPQRLPGLSAIQGMGVQVGHAVCDLARDAQPALRDVDSLACGEGAIVRDGLRKVAAYRDAQGRLHEISPYCPHMKCLLRFHAEECSWDCPCHGSRFSVDGELLCGPSQREAASHCPSPEPLSQPR